MVNVDDKADDVEIIQCEKGAEIRLTASADGSRELSCPKLRTMFVPRHPWLKCGDESLVICIYHDDWKSGKIKVSFPRA